MDTAKLTYTSPIIPVMEQPSPPPSPPFPFGQKQGCFTERMAQDCWYTDYSSGRGVSKPYFKARASREERKREKDKARRRMRNLLEWHLNAPGSKCDEEFIISNGKDPVDGEGNDPAILAFYDQHCEGKCVHCRSPPKSLKRKRHYDE